MTMAAFLANVPDFGPGSGPEPGRGWEAAALESASESPDWLVDYALEVREREWRRGCREKAMKGLDGGSNGGPDSDRDKDREKEKKTESESERYRETETEAQTETETETEAESGTDRQTDRGREGERDSLCVGPLRSRGAKPGGLGA